MNFIINIFQKNIGMKILFFITFLFSIELQANKGLQLLVDENYDAAFRETYSSAISDDKIGQYVIGRILIEGLGSSEQDKKKGLSFLKLSAKQDYLKAILFLADNFYESEIVEQNLQQSLKYMKQAEKLGHKGYYNKITKLTAETTGALSKSSCLRYNKKDRKLADKIAVCINKGFIEGNALQYYLIAFDEGKSSALVNALRIALKQDNPDNLFRVTKRFHTFYKRKKSLVSLVNIFKDAGFDYSVCGASVDEFGFENEEEINIGHCILAALSGDKKAAADVAVWYRDGLNDLPRSKSMSEFFIEQAEKGGSNEAIGQLLKSYEINPKEHFQKIKSYSSDMLLESIIADALKLEAELIAKEAYNEFAKNTQDIIFVLEKVNWKNLSDDVIAKIFIIYEKKLAKKASFDLIDNIKLMPFKDSIYEKISGDTGQKKASNFLISRIEYDCNALDFALKNEGLVSAKKLQEAQIKISGKCSSSGVSIDLLVQNSLNNFEAYKVILEKKLGKPFNCEQYKEFLNNGGDIYLKKDSKLKVDFKSINKKCSEEHPDIAYRLGEIFFKLGLHDEAFRYARNSCESKKVLGCELVAYMLLEKKSSFSDTFSNKREREYEAINYLEKGVQNNDLKSIALLSDVLGDLFSPSQESKDRFIELINMLEPYSTENRAAEIRTKGLCFKNKDFFKKFLFGDNCNNVCRWAYRETTENIESLDFGSQRAIQRINNRRECRALLSNLSNN